jgi:hypothetical protein
MAIEKFYAPYDPQYLLPTPEQRSSAVMVVVMAGIAIRTPNNALRKKK